LSENAVEFFPSINFFFFIRLQMYPFIVANPKPLIDAFPIEMVSQMKPLFRNRNRFRSKYGDKDKVYDKHHPSLGKKGYRIAEFARAYRREMNVA